MPKRTGYTWLLAALFLIAACSSSASRPSSSTGSTAVTTSSSSSSQSTPPQPTTFKSDTYGYTATVPEGLPPQQASGNWDGESELDGSSALVDLFGQPHETRGIFAAAAPWQHDLAAFTSFMIDWTTRWHGDTCPETPDSKNPVTVGGQPGVLTAYNCGILVNNAVTVHHGVAYLFVFVDRGLAAANDPTDHATFVAFLKSVRFPN